MADILTTCAHCGLAVYKYGDYWEHHVYSIDDNNTRFVTLCFDAMTLYTYQNQHLSDQSDPLLWHDIEEEMVNRYHVLKATPNHATKTDSDIRIIEE